jgi:hypothetical protein
VKDLYYQCKGIESWDNCKDQIRKKIKKNKYVEETRKKLEEAYLKKRLKKLN